MSAPFFTDRRSHRPGKYPCPKCHRTNEYSVRWVRRVKKDRLPGGADDGDKARFAKLRDYLLRLDEDVVCKTCGKKFEIPSQHSLLFVDQLAGLPNDAELEEEIRAASARPVRNPPRSRRCPRASRASHPAGSNGRRLEKLELRSQKSELKSRKLEVGSRKLELRY